MKEVIITVVGKNRPGVLAEVSSAIADMNGNIMDISQQIVKGYFNLIMLVDISQAIPDFKNFQEKLERLSEHKGYKISVHNKKMFQYINRI